MANKRARKYCIVCGKEIFRGKNGRTIKTRRGHNSVTCSKKCARIYERVSNYIRCRNKQKSKKIK